MHNERQVRAFDGIERGGQIGRREIDGVDGVIGGEIARIVSHQPPRHAKRASSFAYHGGRPQAPFYLPTSRPLSSFRRQNFSGAKPLVEFVLHRLHRLADRAAQHEPERMVVAPGVAETLDWAATLAGLEVHDLRQEPEAVYETMICLLKNS